MYDIDSINFYCLLINNLGLNFNIGVFNLLNESKLIDREIILRDLKLTGEVIETRRSMVRWLALTLGIINPGESRLSSIYVFDAMLYFQFSKKINPTVLDIKNYIISNWGEINEKTLRYHLLHLKNMNIIDHSKGKYYILIPTDVEQYNESEWLNYYINSEIEPIKDKIVTVIGELKKR